MALWWLFLLLGSCDPIGCLKSYDTEKGSNNKQPDNSVAKQGNMVDDHYQRLLSLTGTNQRIPNDTVTQADMAEQQRQLVDTTPNTDTVRKTSTAYLSPKEVMKRAHGKKRKTAPIAAITILILAIMTFKLIGVYLYGKKVLSRFNKKKQQRHREALERLQHSQNQLMQTYIAASMAKQKKMPVTQEIDDDQPKSGPHASLLEIDLHDSSRVTPCHGQSDERLLTSIQLSPQTRFTNLSTMWRSLDALTHPRHTRKRRASEHIQTESDRSQYLGAIREQSTMLNSAPNSSPQGSSESLDNEALPMKCQDPLTDLTQIASLHCSKSGASEPIIYPVEEEILKFSDVETSVDEQCLKIVIDHLPQGRPGRKRRTGRLSTGSMNHRNILLSPSKSWLSCSNLSKRSKPVSPNPLSVGEFKSPVLTRRHNELPLTTLKVSSKEDADNVQLIQFHEQLHLNGSDKQTEQIHSHHLTCHQSRRQGNKVSSLSSPDLNQRGVSENRKMPIVHENDISMPKGPLKCSASDTMLAIELKSSAKTERQQSTLVNLFCHLVNPEPYHLPFLGIREKCDETAFSEV